MLSMIFWLKVCKSLKTLFKSLIDSSLRGIDVRRVEETWIDSNHMDWVTFKEEEEVGRWVAEERQDPRLVGKL